MLLCLLCLSGREGGLAAEISGWIVEGGWILRGDRPLVLLLLLPQLGLVYLGVKLFVIFASILGGKKNNILNYFFNNFNVLILKIKYENKNYFNIFLSKNIFEKLRQSQRH